MSCQSNGDQDATALVLVFWWTLVIVVSWTSAARYLPRPSDDRPLTIPMVSVSNRRETRAHLRVGSTESSLGGGRLDDRGADAMPTIAFGV